MAGTPAATLLGVTASLYLVVLCLFGVRVHNKVQQKRFRWEDYSITLATVCIIPLEMQKLTICAVTSISSVVIDYNGNDIWPRSIFTTVYTRQRDPDKTPALRRRDGLDTYHSIC